MFSRSLLITAAAVLAPMTVLAQTAADSAPPPAVSASPATSPGLAPNGSIASTLKASSHFTILSKALDQAQLTTVLTSTPGLTMFAPTDEAFNALPAGQLAKLLSPENAPTLQKILIYHLVNLSLDSGKIKGAKGPVPSVESSQLQLDGSADVMKVNDAAIVQANVKASNGIIHVVDKVLIPPDVTLPAAG